jgi:hypothetical protein
MHKTVLKVCNRVYTLRATKPDENEGDLKNNWLDVLSKL